MVVKNPDLTIVFYYLEKQEVISCGMTGSPLYMAPERILERPNSCAVDVWSCGVILFVLLVRKVFGNSISFNFTVSNVVS